METQKTKVRKVTINSDLLQIDLMMEILKRLPVKTLIRFLSVSKLFASTIRSGYFKKLFMNQSLTRPKSIIFTSKIYCEALSSSSSSSSVVIRNTHEVTSYSPSSTSPPLTTYHVSCNTKKRAIIVPSVHGLICYGPASKLVIFNPSTRKSITLPKVNAGKRALNQYIGYDPIENDYKVLCVIRARLLGLAEETWVYTTHEKSSWRRMIQDSIPPHYPESQELCIDGVLYYQAFIGEKLNDSAIMSFDVRSEKFSLIKGPCKFRGNSKLTSYEGKIAVIFYEKKLSGIIGFWVLEDAFKEEWSKKTFELPYFPPNFLTYHRIFQTDTGEIMLTLSSAQISVVYCCLKKKSVMRKYKIERTTTDEENIRCCIVDSVSPSLVENLMFL